MSQAVLRSTSEAPSALARPKPFRVAVVGCGAATRANLLPVLAGHDGVKIVALVDVNRARAQALASAYSIPRAVTNLDEVSADVDGVVLATPPSHHGHAAIALANHGKHVFVEKPMATNPADAEAMAAAADRAGVTLTVGLYRRMLPSVRLLRALLESGEYGRPLSVDAEEGGPYGWQLATLDVLTRSHGGGGVLIDIGSHVIDVLLFTLPGTPRLIGYEDNERGGIETDCVARFAISVGRSEIPVRLELSRTRQLRGSIRIHCERATLELERANFTQVVVNPAVSPGSGVPASSPFRVTAEYADQKPYVGYQAFREEIDDWVSAATSGVEPNLSGRSVLPVVRLIDDCYRTRARIVEPWTDEGLTSHRSSVGVANGRRRVLVTGAGGFLGGRAIELLSGRYGWEVRGLVREPKGAARLARWTHPILVGDICSAADMDRALEGCDAVVHCAVGTSWEPDVVRKVTVDGTRILAEAALRAGVKRFVHISTMFVHRRHGSGVLDETDALEPPANDRYGHNKLLAEKAVQDATARGLNSIILRPSRIYGPFSRTFTVRPLEAIARGEFAIRGEREVPANMTYVDNVVEAVARALEAPDSLSGSAYLINDPEQLSLGEFYDFFARAAGKTIRVLPGRPHTAAASGKSGGLTRWISALTGIARSPELRGLVRRVIDTDPIGRIPRRLWNLSPAVQQALLRRFGADAAVVYRPSGTQSSGELAYDGEPPLVSSAKAERELGFVAPVGRAHAMTLTLAWARYARLLPPAAERT